VVGDRPPRQPRHTRPVAPHRSAPTPPARRRRPTVVPREPPVAAAVAPERSPSTRAKHGCDPDLLPGRIPLGPPRS
jgi:hypothetical protein